MSGEFTWEVILVVLAETSEFKSFPTVYIVTCQAHPVFNSKKSESNVRFVSF